MFCEKDDLSPSYKPQCLQDRLSLSPRSTRRRRWFDRVRLLPTYNPTPRSQLDFLTALPDLPPHQLKLSMVKVCSHIVLTPRLRAHGGNGTSERENNLGQRTPLWNILGVWRWALSMELPRRSPSFGQEICMETSPSSLKARFVYLTLVFLTDSFFYFFKRSPVVKMSSARIALTMLPRPLSS